MRSHGTVLSESALVLTHADLGLLLRALVHLERSYATEGATHPEIDALARRISREVERRYQVARHERRAK